MIDGMLAGLIQAAPFILIVFAITAYRSWRRSK